MPLYSAAWTALAGSLMRSPVITTNAGFSRFRAGDGELQVQRLVLEARLFVNIPNCGSDGQSPYHHGFN